jgi:hypothetical protein
MATKKPATPKAASELYEDMMNAPERTSLAHTTKKMDVAKKMFSRSKDEEAKKDGGWIQKAIKKPGALRSALGAKKGEPIPAKKLAAAAKKPGKMGQRARLAQTLKKMK